MGSKVYRRQVCMSPTHREVPKTNGHSISLPTSIISELHLPPRLGRPLNLRSCGMPRYSLHLGFMASDKNVPHSKSCFFCCAIYHQTVNYFQFMLISPLSFCVCSVVSGATNSSCTSMYEKTFPIKVVQSPTHSTSSGRIHRATHHCTAQEVRCHDYEKVCDFFWISFLTPFFSWNCPVSSWRGEGGLQAASDHGLWWSVIFPSQWQLKCHC